VNEGLNTEKCKIRHIYGACTTTPPDTIPTPLLIKLIKNKSSKNLILDLGEMANISLQECNA
jgi:hypothetical protein